MDMNEDQIKDIQERLDAQEQALVKIYKSTEKTRKIMLWSGIGSVVVFILPLIGVALVLPRIMNELNEAMSLFPV